MQRFTVTSALALLLLSSNAGGAQEFEFEILDEQVLAQLVAAQQSGASPVAAAVGAEVPAEKSPRETKLATMTYDRRPSAMLSAWSMPPEEVADEAEDTEETPTVVEAAAEEVPVEPVEEPTVGPLTEQEAAAAEAARVAEEAAQAAALEAEKLAAEQALIEEEMKALTRNVALGRWSEVKTYFASLTEAEAKAGFKQLVKSLAAGPPRVQGQFANYAEKNFFAPEDVVGLASTAASAVEKEDLKGLGQVLRRCIDAGSLVERCTLDFQAALEAQALVLEPKHVARTLIEASFPVEAGAFLPEAAEAIEANDREALNLLSVHHLAEHAKDAKGGHLDEAWQVLQAVLSDGEVTDEDKEEALKRAVEIAPKVRDEYGQAWLDESFTARPQRGMEILTVIGSASANGLFAQARQKEERTKALELQTTAASALIAAAPELARDWSPTLTLLASNWLTEAEFTNQYDTSTRRGPELQRDTWGNFYYYNYNNRVNSNVPQPISTDDMLKMCPSAAWLALTPLGMQPKFAMVTAQLLLKVGEDSDAFPHIEALAQTHPERAGELVEQFLRVWTKNHNPNQNNNRTNPYIYFYGFEQRKDSIPLTRSKQERNLAELAEWITRIQALPIEELDDKLVATAFMAAHSTAEVYRVETIERVFGAMGDLDPETLAQLVQSMRTNLVGVWRDPATQKDKQTNRRQKDIQSEILRGYEVARTVLDKALVQHPDNWPLTLARASVLHDENNYHQEVAKSSEFAGKRQAAFAEFARAAELYLAQVGELTELEESVDVFETWFYAALGSCDLGAVNERMQLAQAEIPAIRAALTSLAGEVGERHLGKFANTLFTRMSNASPAVKYRYVRAGLEIAGEHELAAEARDVYEYYRDLVTEIRLETRVDGADRVGHERPFGLFVDLTHTREIEREAGGFSKYLVNQNNQGFSWNYGRPTENYRDKFEEAAREALSEQFEIHSVTFNHPDTNSRAIEEYGWRVTPYAYLLLQARGPEVDKVPSLRLDLDFLDTTGYAVLPIESAPLPVDASATGDRPFEKLEITQTLDERQSKEGKLILEIKARALGLVPDLPTVLKVGSEGFEVIESLDQGLSVAKFDEESDEAAVVSERTWMVSMHAREDLESLPESFSFATPLAEEIEMEYQRFVDADLESVEPVVALEQRYGERSLMPLLTWIGGGTAALLVGLAGFGALRRGRSKLRPRAAFEMPERVSAFSVLGLLRDIESKNGLAPARREELQREIRDLEGLYFQDREAPKPDLEALARTWLARV